MSFHGVFWSLWSLVFYSSAASMYMISLLHERYAMKYPSGLGSSNTQVLGQIVSPNTHKGGEMGWLAARHAKESQLLRAQSFCFYYMSV